MKYAKCPECGGKAHRHGTYHNAKGQKLQRLHCLECHRYSQIKVKGEK